MVTTAAVIPALDEERTVAGVVATAAASPLVDEVIVVDSGSRDRTAEFAARAGARVVTEGRGGKGQAMAAGVAATDADTIVFLDADLIGLRPDHVDRLVRAVTSGGAGMACGLFDRGRRWNWLFLHVSPILTGERALPRALFESVDHRDIAGYRVEAALNSRAGELGLDVTAFVCDGMSHRRKEEKHASRLAGLRSKLAMIATAYASGARYTLRWKLRRWPPAPRRTSPAASRVDQAGSSAGAVMRTPGRSHSQRSRGRSPSQDSS